MRELAANATASKFPLTLVPVRLPVVPEWELVDSAERPTASAFLPLN